MSELRHDPIQRRWVIIASERGRRPSDFSPKGPPAASTDAPCPLCGPGEVDHRAIARRHGPDGPVTVVPNRFPALQVEGEVDRRAVGPYDRAAGVGAHEVIVESPHHDHDLPDMSTGQVAEVLLSWRDRIVDLRRDVRLKYIQVFRNRGVEAGASLHHPHSQLVAIPVYPLRVQNELQAARQHFLAKERCIFCDVITFELEAGQRVVRVDDQFVTVCPYASRVPFEMVLMPRRHSHDFGRLSEGEALVLAEHLSHVIARMRRSLDGVGYNLVLLNKPNTHAVPKRPHQWESLADDWHWRLEILPRVTSLAGFEWGTGFYVNPTAPEDAAAHLRSIDLGNP